MRRGAATIAIVATRLRKELRVLCFAIVACALLAYLQRYDDSSAQLAGTLVFGTLIGISAALLQRGSGRFQELELCEQSAPLYGRELARATALVPCTLVSAALVAYWIVALFYAETSAAYVALSLIGVNAATLVALSATVRSGLARMICIVLACAVGAAAFGLSKTPAALAVGVCVLFGFVALRQYGEALAKYDPAPL